MLPTYTFAFSLPIWRLLYDTIPVEGTTSLIAIELRNKSKVEWAVVNLETDSILWQKPMTDTNWWTSLIGFYSGILLFHTYAGNEQPAPKSLLAIDAQTGVLLWKSEGYIFSATDGHLLKTTQTHSDLQVSISNKNLREGTISTASAIQLPETAAFWHFPTEHTEGSQYYSVITQFLQKIIGKTAQKAINYGEIDGRILFFQYLYHANATALSRSILVVNTKKNGTSPRNP